MTDEIKKLSNETILFEFFYKMLCDALDKDGELDQIIVENCLIKNVPEHYLIFEQKRVLNFLGIKIYEIGDRFCGFKMKSCIIMNNQFQKSVYKGAPVVLN